VLEAPRKKTGPDQAYRVPVPVDTLHRDGRQPGQVAVGARHGQTPLGLSDQLAIGRLLEHGVDDVRDGMPTRRVRTVDDEHAGVDADLVRGQPDPLRGVHRREHVHDQPPELVVEHGDRPARTTQNRMAVERDWSDNT